MLSSFLKKLLFARQFFMINGKIEVLGKPQVMLPSNLIAELEKGNNEDRYASIKEIIAKEMEDYAKKIGGSEEGLLKNIDDLFETFGLGKLEVVGIDYKKKHCIVRVHNSPLRQPLKMQNRFAVTPAILSGMFSFIFGKAVNAKQVDTRKMGMEYGEYVLQ